jgi:hypothetical protein
MKNAPPTDLTHGVITVLRQKAKALEVYDKCIEHAGQDAELVVLFRVIRRQDVEHVRVLTEALARCLALRPGLGGEEEEKATDRAADDFWGAEEVGDDRLGVSADDEDGAGGLAFGT